MNLSEGARQSWLRRLYTAAPVRTALLFLCLVWSIPTAGMLVSSFRTTQEINRTGWWSAFWSRENPEYNSLADRVERSETFAERTQAQLEERQVALEAGPTPEALDEAIVEAQAALQEAVTDAEEALAKAQTDLENGVDGAEQAVTDAQATLATAQAALAAGVNVDAIRQQLTDALAEDVQKAADRAANAQNLLATDRQALADTDEPERFALFSKGWREQWTLDNYDRVVNANAMDEAFLNSLLITIPSVVIPITIAAFAAYAFAWLEFPAKDFFFSLVIVAMGVPLHLALIPILRLYIRVDLGGTFLGVWLAHTGFGLPLAIYLIYGYMITIPRDILESAHIDGASPFTAFTRLILPLSVPVIAAFAIFQFLWVWNDLLIALVFLGTEAENAVLTTRLTQLVGSKGQDWEILTAGAFITMAVPLTIFFALQRFFVRGLTAGSVKG